MVEELDNEMIKLAAEIEVVVGNGCVEATDDMVPVRMNGDWIYLTDASAGDHVFRPHVCAAAWKLAAEVGLRRMKRGTAGLEFGWVNELCYDKDSNSFNPLSCKGRFVATFLLAE